VKGLCNYRSWLYLAISLPFVPLSVNAQTLPDVVNAACQYHPETHTAQILVNEAKERVNEAKSAVLPRVSSITEFGIAEEFSPELTPIDNSRSTSTQLSLDQPLYLGGRGRAAIDSAKSAYRSQGFESEAQVLGVQLNAIQAYISYARAGDVLGVRQENLAALERRRKDANRRYELGAGTLTDISQADARIERGLAEIVSAQQDIQEASASLFETSLVQVSGELEFPRMPRLPLSLQEALEDAVVRNPNIQSAEALLDAADANVRAVQHTFYPEVRLLGEVSAQRDTAFNGFEQDDARLRLRMTVPLFAGGALKARGRQTLYAKNRAYFNKNLVINRVREAVTTGWTRHRASAKLTEVNQNLVKAAEAAAMSVKKEADAGFRPSIDTLDAQQELLEARLALTNARYDEVLAGYFLLGAMGSLASENFETCLSVTPKPHSSPNTIEPERPRTRTIGHGVKWKEAEPEKRAGPRGK